MNDNYREQRIGLCAILSPPGRKNHCHVHARALYFITGSVETIRKEAIQESFQPHICQALQNYCITVGICVGLMTMIIIAATLA